VTQEFGLELKDKFRILRSLSWWNIQHQRGEPYFPAGIGQLPSVEPVHGCIRD
jgi:hypothetical protein